MEHESPVSPYVPSRGELARKLVNISDEAIKILNDCRKTIMSIIRSTELTHQVGGIVSNAAKDIGYIAISGAYYFEGYMRRCMRAHKEYWPAVTALDFIDQMIETFAGIKNGQKMLILD